MLCKAAQGVLSNIKKPEYLPRYDYFKCPHLKTRGPEEQTLQGLHHWRGNFNLEFKGWALTTSAHRRLPGQNVLLHTRERKHQGKESCVKKQLGDKQRLKEILKSGKRKTPEPTRSPWGAHTTLTGRTESGSEGQSAQGRAQTEGGSLRNPPHPKSCRCAYRRGFARPWPPGTWWEPSGYPWRRWRTKWSQRKWRRGGGLWVTPGSSLLRRSFAARRAKPAVPWLLSGTSRVQTGSLWRAEGQREAGTAVTAVLSMSWRKLLSQCQDGRVV